MTAFGQSAITGRVVSKGVNEAVPSVSVSLTDATTKRIIGGGFTNKEGRFSIPISDALLSQKVTLTLSHLAYEKLSMTEPASQFSGRTFVLSNREEKLKEVVVRATTVRKRGDTIRYSVGQLIKLGDHTLEDAIKRIPGMQVDKSGRISYEGKSINKFYIEGLDLMGGKYGLATKNIKADDVAALEVLENHEPVKIKKDRSLSDQAALNVRLKESAKNNWIYALTTGVGINKEKKPLYLGDGSAYTFGKDNQAMIIGKGANTGRDIFSELNTLAPDEVIVRNPYENSGREDFFSTGADMGDEVVRDRGRINTTALGSFNFLHRISEDAKWRVNANYGFDQAKREKDETTYFRLSPTEIRIVQDHTSLLRQEHYGEIESDYTYNGSKKFAKVQTLLKFAHKDLKADMSTNGNPYSQHTLAPAVVLKNNISWSKKLGKNILSISDALWLDYMPQKLSLHAESPLPGNTDKVIQDAKTNSISNDLKLDFDYFAGRFQLNAGSNLKYLREHYDTDLYFPALGADAPLKGDLTYSRIVLEVSPRFIYRVKRWRFSVTPEVKLFNTSAIEKNIADGTMSRGNLWFTPSAGLFYEGHSIDWMLSANHGTNEPSALDHYSPYIFRGINFITRGARRWWESKRTSLYTRLAYKDIFNFFSAVYSANLALTHTPMSVSTRLQDIYRLHSPEAVPQKGRMFSQNLDLQKIFQSAGITTNLSVMHGFSDMETNQQGLLYHFNTHNITLSPTIEWQVKTGFSIKYGNSLNRSFFRLKGADNYTVQDAHVHTLSVFAKPAKSLLLNATGRLYYNKSEVVNEGRPHKFYVFDASAEWNLSWATLILSAKNIGGSSVYRIERQSALNAYSGRYYLRPSEVFLTMRWKLPSRKP